MFTLGRGHHEIASYRGGLQYMVMKNWAVEMPVARGSFNLDVMDDVWSLTAINPNSMRQMLGFISASGNLGGPLGLTHPYGMFRAPYLSMMIPFALILFRQAVLLERSHRRRRLGLCRKCGYDLRESKGGRCPECGGETPAVAAGEAQPATAAAGAM